jgi:hypothetical protein
MIAATGSVSTFYLGSQRELFPADWRHQLRFLPFILATGIGLTITNTCAVLEGLFGRQSEFVRTPKYRIVDSVSGHRHRFFQNAYRRRSHWVPIIEILIGSYFAFAVNHALGNENYATAMFLSLFMVGYLGTGLVSLFQGRCDRLAETLSVYFAGSRRPVAKGVQES